MEEQLILRPQAVGAKQRRKRFEASTSDSQISGKSQTSVSLKEEINDDEGRKFKRIKSCPPAMLGEKLNPPKQTSISVNLTINSSGLQNADKGKQPKLSKSHKKERVSFQIKQNTGKKTKQSQRTHEGPPSMRQRVFQRSLTGNMRVPRRVNDPSFPYQAAYHQGKYKQHPMYSQQHASVPRFKPAFPTPIEKVDLLIGDYFSGLPDGTEYTWNETVTDIERGYPEPVGAMLGMTGSETTFMHPSNPMGHSGYSAYNTQDPRAVDPIFNSQVPTQNPFHWQSIPEDRVNSAQYIPEIDPMPLQQDNEHGTLPIEVVQKNQADLQANKSAEDELAEIDNIDGTNMTKILIDLGFSGENLFTWHT